MGVGLRPLVLATFYSGLWNEEGGQAPVVIVGDWVNSRGRLMFVMACSVERGSWTFDQPIRHPVTGDRCVL